MKPKELFAKAKSLIDGNRLVVLGIKYIPLLCTALMVFHVGFLLMGRYEPVTAGISVFLILILLILLSFRFGFCRLHKAMIIYMAAMTVCICVQKYDGFGSLLTVFRILMLIAGVSLVVLALMKGGCDDCDK